MGAPRLTAAQRRERALEGLLKAARENVAVANKELEVQPARSLTLHNRIEFLENEVTDENRRARQYTEGLRSLHASVARYVRALADEGPDAQAAALFRLGATYQELEPLLVRPGGYAAIAPITGPPRD